jgi:hypothetical protein
MKKTPRYIFLTRGQFTVVDWDDFDWLSQFNWFSQKRYGTLWHATRKAKDGGQPYMHREIIKAPAGMLVDHIDGDGLNNRRSNLRLATKQTNAHNAKRRSDNKSGFKGVSLANRCKGRPWVAVIQTTEKRQKFLGYFAGAEEAGRAYDAAAQELYGEFARLNFGIK